MRVLLVEDYLDTADMVMALLGHFGCTAQHAPDGKAALDIAGSWKPDIVFMDIGLPEMDGYETAQRLRRDVGFAGPIYAISGFQPDEKRHSASGISDHLMKPIDVRVLRKLVEC